MISFEAQMMQEKIPTEKPAMDTWTTRKTPTSGPNAVLNFLPGKTSVASRS